jgi:hypothetical protein
MDAIWLLAIFASPAVMGAMLFSMMRGMRGAPGRGDRAMAPSDDEAAGR